MADRNEDPEDSNVTGLNTHPKFKTLMPHVTSAADLQKCMLPSLLHQSLFERRTTPFECNEWDYKELQEFEINTEIVDRIYYINASTGYCYQMITRMDYNFTPLYVEIVAICCCIGFRCHGAGFIFVSRDANLFMKLVLSPLLERTKARIYKSLAEDSISMEMEEEEDKYSTYSREIRKTLPTLKYLCHEAVYLNREILRRYSSVLPKILIKSVDEFIKTNDAILAYEDDYCKKLFSVFILGQCNR